MAVPRSATQGGKSLSTESVDPRTRAGDPGEATATYKAGMARLKRSRRTYGEEMEAVAEEETRLGRPMSHREREAFARGFHGEEYVEEIRLLARHGRLDG
jgi:hypothetical protein